MGRIWASESWTSYQILLKIWSWCFAMKHHLLNWWLKKLTFSYREHPRTDVVEELSGSLFQTWFRCVFSLGKSSMGTLWVLWYFLFFLCFSRVLGRVPKIIHYLREEHPPVFPLVFHLAVTVKLCRILCWQTQRTRWRLEVVVRGTTKKPGTGPEMSVPWDLETNHNLGFTQKGTIFQLRIFHGDTTTSKKGTDWKKEWLHDAGNTPGTTYL